MAAIKRYLVYSGEDVGTRRSAPMRRIVHDIEIVRVCTARRLPAVKQQIAKIMRQRGRLYRITTVDLSAHKEIAKAIHAAYLAGHEWE